MELNKLVTKVNHEIKVALPVGKEIKLLGKKEIICIESLGNYCQVHTQCNGRLIIYMSMKRLEEELSEYSFFRISRSCLLNILHLADYETRSRKVILANGGEVFVSRRTHTNFKEYLAHVSLS